MKLIEALKELPLIEKKVARNVEKLREYASAVDNGKVDLKFSTEALQRKEIESLLQSSNDLANRADKLRRAIALTNANTNVTIKGETRTILEWISFRRNTFQLRLSALQALSDTASTQQMRNTPVDPAVGIRVVRFYDEKNKNEKIEDLHNLYDAVDSTLEIVNATTDIVVEL